MQAQVPPDNPDAFHRSGKSLARAYWLSTFLLAAAYLSTLISVGINSDSNWPEALLILFAVVSTLAALTRHLPLQNVLLAALVIAAIGGGIHALGVETGIPFGPFDFQESAGTKIFNALPWTIPLLWVVIVLNSRGVARLILRPWRKVRTYGFWLIGLTVGLATIFDMAMEPFAAHMKHYWIWLPTDFPFTWEGAPLVNFISWAAVLFLILAFVTPVLINKQLSKPSAPDLHPLVVWLGAVLLFAIGAATHGLWSAVAADAVIYTVVTVFAIRGAWW